MIKRATTATQNPSAARYGADRSPFLTVNDLAMRWRLSSRQIRRMIASGEVQVTRIGRRVLIAADAVAAVEGRRGDAG